MASVKYFIRSKKKGSDDVSIYARLRTGKIDIRVSTTISVPFNLWNDAQGCIKPYYQKEAETIKRLERAEAELKEIRGLLLNIADSMPEISVKEVSDYIVKFLESKRASKTDTPKDMNKYISHLISQMKNGERLANGKTYSTGSIKAWNSFQKTWNTFQHDYLKRKLGFEDIDMVIHSKFIDYCNNKPYTADTTRKYLTSLIAVLSYAVGDKVSDNRIYEDRKDFSKRVPRASGKKPYLTEKELDAIFRLELADPMLKKVRDVFLIGCYCGQRVSDFSRIKKENIISLSDGSKAFNITQQKTGTRTIIPFLSPNIEMILERWYYDLPNIVDVLINRHIKTICEAAKITEPFTMETMIGGKLKKETKPKCNFITCHTARRSAITNLYKKGIFDIKELRSISGHKTDASFEAYICLSDEEQAEKIAKKLKTKKR